MHNANAGEIEYPARSPQKSLAHSPAPLCGTPRRNSARVSWAAGFIGQHCRTHDTGQQHNFILSFPRPTRAPHCAACRWQMPRSGSQSRSTRVFLCGFGYSFRRQPAPRAPPLAPCSSRFLGKVRARNGRASAALQPKERSPLKGSREYSTPQAHGGRSLRVSAFWGMGAQPARCRLGVFLWGNWLSRLRKRADAPARRRAAQGLVVAAAHLRRRSHTPLRGKKKFFYAVATASRRSRPRQPQGDISPFSPCGQITRKPGRRQGCYRTAKRLRP